MTAPGLPVIVASNGRGLPVTVVSNGRGIPIQTSANGFGVPIVVKASGGLPVQYVNGSSNLFAGPWIQGASTTMTIAGGRVRAAKNGANPRVYKAISGLTNGATYKLSGGSCFKGTQTGNMILRASTAAEIPNGDMFSDPNDFVINFNFIATATTMYIGMVAIATANGEYAEITDALSLVLVP